MCVFGTAAGIVFFVSGPRARVFKSFLTHALQSALLADVTPCEIGRGLSGWPACQGSSGSRNACIVFLLPGPREVCPNQSPPRIDV